MTNIKEVEAKLDMHIQEYEQHKVDWLAREAALFKVQEINCKAQEINTKNIAELTKSTDGLVKAWNAAVAFQIFLKWLSGFAIIGVAAAWLLSQGSK